MAETNAMTYCNEQHIQTESYITTLDIGTLSIYTVGSINGQLTIGPQVQTEDSGKDNALAILNTMAGYWQWRLQLVESDDMEM